MLCHLVSCPCDDEACGSGDIEGVLSVAAGAHHVNIPVGIEDGRHACLKNTVPESEQFVYGDAPHLQTGEQRRDLLVGIFTVCDSDKNSFHLLS